jgi:hypothetical protein
MLQVNSVVYNQGLPRSPASVKFGSCLGSKQFRLPLSRGYFCKSSLVLEVGLSHKFSMPIWPSRRFGEKRHNPTLRFSERDIQSPMTPSKAKIMWDIGDGDYLMGVQVLWTAVHFER